jgi:DNA phosphorothioation-dependent restriction protein DptG
MSKLVQIQKAIEQLKDEEKQELREWLEADVAETEQQWLSEAKERLRGIRAGERTTVDAFDVLAEGRRIVRQ